MVRNFLPAALLSLLAVNGANAATGSRQIGVNVLLDARPTSAMLARLASHGTVLDVVPKIRAVTLRTTASELRAIRALPHVVAANPDARRKGIPIDTVDATNF